MEIADKIILLMQKTEISNQKELAKQIDIPYTTLKNIIDGKATDIRLSTATKICKFFGITYDELFSDNLKLSDIRLASYEGLDTKGLDVTDVKEVNDFIKYVKSKKTKK